MSVRHVVVVAMIPVRRLKTWSMPVMAAKQLMCVVSQ